MSTQSAPARPVNRTIQDAPTRPMPAQGDGHREHAPMAPPAMGTETKNAFRTTEFWVYVVAVAAVLIASTAIGIDAAGIDQFGAPTAWFYVTLLTIAYLGSRGLAKAGSAWRSGAERSQRRR